MITRDGYEVVYGMWLEKIGDPETAYYIKSAGDDCAVYNEYKWNEEKGFLEYTGDGGLLMAEEIEKEYFYI